MRRAIKNPERILQNSQVVGRVETPKGDAIIWELIESRGYQTNYLPQAFRYVQLPDNGNLFSIKKYMLKHWKDSGFNVIYY